MKTLTKLFAAIIASLSMAAVASAHSGEKAQALANAQVSAVQAIQAATAHTAGQASEVDFSNKYGQAFYEVDVVSNQQKHEIHIDANTGKVLNSRVKRADYDDLAITQAKVSLIDAINVVESKTGQKVKEAHIDDEHGQLLFEVETLAPNMKQELRVDATTGNVL